MLTEKMKAPEFTLTDKDGNKVSLADFRGKRVVLYFYPKDNTAGCSKQASLFAELNDKIEALGAVVIGVSKDSEASHRKFAQKYSLPFTLLSDPERIAIEAYGVWQEKKMCGKVGMGVVRSTFIIDEDGNIEKTMYNVKSDKNPAEVLGLLEAKK
ncbi:MAG: peroxiredoxin [Clostridia bacterium]|nr:peroxiredoxin [Clostridia bacterium]